MADEFNPFDLEAYPEDQRDKIAPLIEQAKAAQEAASRYEGIDLDPDALRNAAEMYSAYTDPQRSQAYREAMARQWNVLPEGMTLDELSDIARQVYEYNTAQANQELDYNTMSELDPAEVYRTLEENILGRVEERIKSWQETEQDRQREAEAQRHVEEITAQESQLYSQLKKQGREVSDWEREQLEARIALRLQREELSPENFHSFVQDTWEDFDSHIGERAAALLKAQKEAPRTGGSDAGATPGGRTVVTDLKSAEKFLEEMIQAHRGE